MSRRIWESKKDSLKADAEDHNKRSPVLDLLQCDDQGDEWRSVWIMKTSTLVKRQNGAISLAAPILVGIRYCESFLAEAPHPMEIVTVLQPNRLFNPNCSPAGGMCLGHPEPGLTLSAILHQVWAGLTFNMRKINTSNGEILNTEAARFVRGNAERFPLTEKGIFEKPDVENPTKMPFLFGQIDG